MPAKRQPSGSQLPNPSVPKRDTKPNPKARSKRRKTKAPAQPQPQPHVVEVTGLNFQSPPFRDRFKHEVASESEDPEFYDQFIRAANHFSFVRKGTLKMINWDGQNFPGGAFDMIAYVAPLSGGPRKCARSLSGYTPIYKDESNPSVWGLLGIFTRVRVKGPLIRDQLTLLNHPFDGVYIHDDKDEVVYLLQHPDHNYCSYFQRTVDSWNRQAETEGKAQLVHFESVDLEKPRPSWMILWVMQMLRLEAKKPRDVAGDTPGDTASGSENSRAPTPGVPTDNESDCSDAESIIDEVNSLMLPNSHTWDWATKSSRHWETFPDSYSNAWAEQGALAAEDPVSPFGAQQLTPEPGNIPTPGFRTETPETDAAPSEDGQMNTSNTFA